MYKEYLGLYYESTIWKIIHIYKYIYIYIYILTYLDIGIYNIRFSEY